MPSTYKDKLPIPEFVGDEHVYDHQDDFFDTIVTISDLNSSIKEACTLSIAN